MTGESAATTGEWEGSHRPVVVAVDGSDRNRDAVSWAAGEAATLGCSVELVTALQEHVVAAPRSLRRRSSDAQDMLADVRSRVEHVVTDQEVRTLALTGAPVEVLLERARSARMVVLGKRGLGGFARVLVGSTSIAVAGRSPVPVVVIPDGWHPADHSDRPIVLGVDPEKADHRPIHVAFSRAQRLGVTLVAVHGWELPAAYSWDADTLAGDTAGMERSSHRRFDEVLESWRSRFPDVAVRTMHAHQHPAAAVLEAAEVAQLIVLGRHAEGIFGGFAFGSVARAVMHYAECPVLVVPAEPAAAVDPD